MTLVYFSDLLSHQAIWFSHVWKWHTTQNNPNNRLAEKVIAIECMQMNTEYVKRRLFWFVFTCCCIYLPPLKYHPLVYRDQKRVVTDLRVGSCHAINHVCELFCHAIGLYFLSRLDGMRTRWHETCYYYHLMMAMRLHWVHRWCAIYIVNRNNKSTNKWEFLISLQLRSN